MTTGIAAARTVRPGVIVALVVALMLVAMPRATAHETREVDRFTFVVGFGDEPAYSNIPNAVSLAISEAESGEPFVDLIDTLDVDVIFGEETMTMTMEPAFRVGAFGTPGDYAADFVPSRPGQYTFHFHGTVGGVEIDEEFVSGPETFDEVQSISEASFPVQDPSTGELADRLDRELARLSEQGDESETGGSSSDGVARGLSVAALVLGVAAMGTALVLVRRRQSRS